MRHPTAALILALLAVLALACASGEGARLVINEVMASNGTWTNSHAYDWVELHNVSGGRLGVGLQVAEKPRVLERGASDHYGGDPGLGHQVGCGLVVDVAVAGDRHVGALDEFGDEVVVYLAAVFLRSEATMDGHARATCRFRGVEQF